MTNRDYDKPLEFDLAIGKQKPNTVRRHEKYCSSFKRDFR